MTQYTKFTKNINYNENNYSNLQNGGINTPINHQNLTKVASRGSNMTGISTTNGSPALTLNTSNLPKPVLITNLNSSNISSLIKNERIKSSSIARSVTMRYNTNTKLQFDNSPNFSNPNSTTTNSNNNNNNNNNNQTANHFHYNRRSLQQTQSPPHQQLHHQPLPQQHQQQIQLPLTSTNPNLSSVDTSLSNQQAKKEYLSLLSNIHRSQSIKLNRDKSNLSGFFNGLVNNREKTNNSNFNGGTSSNLANLNSNSNNSNNNTNNYLTLNSKFNSRKTQPFSLRNNNGSNSGLYNANNTSNNSINLNNSSDINYNNNSNTISKQISNSNNRLSEISKNSISLDNVYNGLDLIIANEHKYNKIENMTNNNNNNNSINNNTNKSNNSLAYLNSKKSSNTPQIFASTHTHASNNSINFNFGNQNYSIDNSNNRVINELNLLKNKKRAQKLEIDEEITHNSSNINNNNNNNDENITKELSSSRSNHLKPNELNENDETNLLDEIEHYNKVASIHQNGIVAGVSMNESSLLKATNYFAKKVKPSKSELRHIKLNDESIYNNKISKLDLIDQLDIYQPKQTTNSINYLKVANKQLSGTSPSINHSHHPHHQLNNSNNNTAHSPVNRFKNELQLQQQQQQRNLIEYNNKTGSSLMLDSTTQSNKLNQSRSQLTRNHSRLSHITRDVNDSYAYTNVQQYIEENDLMPPEKAHSIKKWIIEVNSNYDDWEKKTVEKHIEDSFV